MIRAYQKITPSMVRRGFEVSGQSCAPDQDGLTIIFEMIMRQCFGNIAPEQLMLIKSETSYFVGLIEQQGTIFYQQFIEKEIQAGPTSINRDDLTHI